MIWILLIAAMLAACSPYPRESERMAEAMAQAEAVYGDGGLLIETDTALFIPGLAEASQYYAGKRQYGKAALAALYNGYTERDFDKESAMVSFKEAERYGELAGDSLTMARAEYWMGRFLFEENRNEEALPLFKASRDRIGTSFVDKAVVENSLAVVYIVLKQFDRAEICLQNSLDYAQDCCLDQMEWKIINNYSVLHRVRGEYDLSLDYQRGMLRKPWLDDAKRVYVYLNMGNAFAVMSEMDSAAFYYQRLDSIVQVVSVRDETKVSVYGALLRFAKTQGDDSLILRYYEQHESALYDVMSQRQEQSIYRIQKRYDYETLQNAMNQKLARNHLVIAIVIGLLLLVLVLYLFRSAQASRREARANANLFHFMQQNKALVESNMAQEQKTVDMEQRLSDLLYARLYAMQQLDYCLKTPKDKGALKDLEHEVFGKGDHWDAMKQILMELYPGLWESLRLKYPEMDELELRVSMLSRLKLSRQGEAALLGISTSVLDKIRTKVKKTTEEC